MESTPAGEETLLIFSARTPEALDQLSAGLGDHLASGAALNIDDAAFTLATGRAKFPHRGAVVCSGTPGAVRALSEQPSVRRGIALPAGADVVFMFPGQGSQRPRMGSDAYARYAAFRDAFDECASLLRPELGVDLHEVIAADGADAANRLNETWLAQPALFATEYAYARLWMSWGIKPAAMIGHSVGEYVAACVAGVFDLPTALKLIAARGRLMWEQARGAMLAVSMPHDQLQRRLSRDLSIAAINGATACVVAGPADAIDAFSRELEAASIAGTKLHTSHAFHSAMMDGVIKPFSEVLRACTFKRPTVPFISNVTGSWATAEQVMTPDYWLAHARQAVRFADGVGELLKDPRRVFLEVGAGDTLSRLVRQHASADRSRMVVSTASKPRESGDPVMQIGGGQILDALGQLWIAGVDVDWARYFNGQVRRRVALPLYPFARERHWVNPPDKASVPMASASAAMTKQPLDKWFYLPSWSASLPPAKLRQGELGNHRWLVLTNGSAPAQQLVDRLAAEGQSYQCVSESDSLSTIDVNGITQVLHLWTLESAQSPDLATTKRRGYDSLVAVGQLLARREAASPVTVTVVTRQLHDPSMSGDADPALALMMGPCLAIPQEHAELTFRTIDIGSSADALSTDALLAEILAGTTEPHVAYRGTARFVPRYERVDIPAANDTAATLRKGGVYLITGGHGKVGVHLAELLFQQCGARIALLSRNGVASPRLEALRARGAEVLSLKADVSNESEMREAIGSIKNRFGALHGVVHAAGTLDHPSFSCFIESLTEDVTASQFGPKVSGVQVLDRVLDGEALDFCILISSNSAILGGLGFAAYGAANRYMDAFVAKRNRRSGTPWLSTNWDTWSFEQTTPSNELSMAPGDSHEAFRRILARMPAGQVVIGTGDVNARFDQWVRRSGWQSTGLQAHTKRIHLRPTHAGTIVEPETASERVLVALWKEIFGFADVSVDDDFFALGGDSLSGIRLMAMIKDAVGKKLPLNALLKEPTIRALAAELDRGDDTTPWSPLVSISTTGSRPPLFCVPGTGGSVVYLRELAQALAEHDRPFYAFQAAGLDGRMPPAESIEALAATNIAALLEFQKTGPYFLGGHSFGSWVAIEMAHQLTRQGHEVAMVAILDTAAPADRDLSSASVRNDTEWLAVVGDQLAHMFGKSVDLQLDSLASLDWPAKLDRFAQAMIDSGVVPRDADRAEIRGFVNVYRVQAMMRYTPAPGYPPVNLVLLRAADALADFVDGIPAAMRADDSWGWRDYAAGRVVVETVPGDHLTMMTRPHCHALAAALHRQLTSVESAGAIAAAGTRSS